MYTLGFPFRPWPGDLAIADGAAIRAYIADTARAFGIDAHIRFGHRVLAAAWSSAQGRWTLDVEASDGARVTMTCRVLYMGSGYYDYGKGFTPRWDGVEDFAGTLVHPQHWPADLATAGQRIVVIGSGATAVTLVPALAATGAQVTMLQRSPSYIVARPATDSFARVARRVLPRGAADRAARWKSVLLGIATFAYARKRPAQTKAMILKNVRALLPDNYAIERDFAPDYDPWDQRVCQVPDGDLFHALNAGTAAIVTDTIDRFTAQGIRLTSGRELPAEIVVTATGLVVTLFGGVRLSVDGRPVDPADHLVYKGMMLGDVPNLVLAFGYTNASWTLKCDLTARYACRLIRHMDRRGQAAFTPRGDRSVVREPMLGFTSGYVARAAAMLPHQGPKAPWRVHQNYVLDLAVLGLGRVDDGVMAFTKRGVPVAGPVRARLHPALAFAIGAGVVGGAAWLLRRRRD